MIDSEKTSLAEVLQWRKKLHLQNRRLVMTCGCFDGLHPGHLQLLSWAKAQGDTFLVALNSDQSVANLKGPQRPRLPWLQRANQLRQTALVERILPLPDSNASRLLSLIQPEVFVKGSDYNLTTLNPWERQAIESYQGTIAFSPLLPDWSTTRMIQNLNATNSRHLKVLFLDRDGVLNRETGHVTRPEDLQIIPSALQAVRELQEANIRPVIITNQSGIARGLITESQLEKIHQKLQDALEKSGCHPLKIYTCPTHPGPLPSGNKDFIRHDFDRKPSPGLLFKAIKELDLQIENCAMAGDSPTDAQAASAAGIPFYLVKSPNSSSLPKSLPRFDNLLAVTRKLLRNEGA